MKQKAKSSITLPAEELALVQQLKRQVGAKSNVEVIRKSLRLLKETTQRESLRQAYRKAVADLANSTKEAIAEMDGLTGEGLD